MKPGMLLLVPLIVVLLAACGAPSAQAPTSAPAPIATPAPTAAPASVSQSDSVPITIKHSLGTLTLPKPATRVVACSEEAVDFLITLGVQPIGICSDRVSGAGTGVPYELPHFFPQALLGTPMFVGTADSPSLEQIVALKPDLIISGVWAEAANINVQI